MTTELQLRHRQIEADGLDLHAVEAGESNGADFLLLHGWPEDWSVYEKLLRLIGTNARAVALDLPGIGSSSAPPPTGNKRWLAARLPSVVRVLDLRDVTLVGHDVGGQIAYAALRVCPETFTHVQGLRHAGCVHVNQVVIADCGHFAPSERPEQVAAALRHFAQVPAA